MESRPLRVLRIDDAIDMASPAAIRTWADAQVFWRRFSGDPPDVVLCDINFDKDTDAPLSKVDEYYRNPAGLLYALPFLALAKAANRPIALVFHTGDPALFTIRELQNRPPEALRLLAGHLAAIAMAMLGDRGTEGPVGLEEALQWIWKEGPRPDQVAADLAARAQFRRRLVRMARPVEGTSPLLLIHPDNYQRLLNWCTRAASLDELPATFWDKDPGVLLIRPDGSKDCLQVRDLFDRNTRFVPELFEVSGGNAATAEVEGWKNAYAEAQVGDLVHALGNWPRLVRRAEEIVARFPQSADRPNRTLIDEVPKTKPGNDLVRLLVLVLQWRRLRRAAESAWALRYTSEFWDPAELRFDPDQDDARNTLRDQCRDFHAILREFRSAWGVDEDDSEPVLKKEDIATLLARKGRWGLVLQGGSLDTTALDRVRDGRGVDQVQFHIDLLVDLGLLTVEDNDPGHIGWYVVPDRPFPEDRCPRCPPRPTGLRAPWMSEGEGWTVTREALAASLGFGGSATKELQRIPAKALYGGHEPSGTDFLRAMDQGLLPGWLATLLEPTG